MSAQNSAGEPGCEITGHTWGYHGVTMPSGYAKPISGPVCLTCGEWKGPEQFSAICPSVWCGTPPWPMPADSPNVSINTSELPLGQAFGALHECTVPPPGWRCTRGYHADGPCAAVPTKPCLNCGGTGCLKEYENVAGDYHYVHCQDCDGTGHEIPGLIAAKREAVRVANEERERQRKRESAARWQRIKDMINEVRDWWAS